MWKDIFFFSYLKSYHLKQASIVFCRNTRILVTFLETHLRYTFSNFDWSITHLNNESEHWGEREGVDSGELNNAVKVWHEKYCVADGCVEAR